MFERRRLAREARQRLIDAANEAGGRDNITVILFRLEEVDGTEARRPRGRRPVREDDTAEYETFEGDAVPRRARACAPRRRQRRGDPALSEVSDTSR